MLTRTGTPYLRTPKFRGSFYIRTVRGRLTVSAWPRKRGKPKSPNTVYMNAWFKDAMRKLRYVDARAMNQAIKLTKGTGLYPRDVLMKASSGGLFDIHFKDGTVSTFKQRGVWPVAFQGAITHKTANQAVPANVLTALTWPLPTIDTAGLFNLALPTRFTIPAMVNVVNLSVHLNQSAAGITRAAIIIRKNGVTTIVNDNRAMNATGGIACSTGPQQVVQGDYFEALAFFNGAATVLAGEQTGWHCELLDVDYPPVPA